MCSDQPTGRLALVFELMDRNIYELIRGRRHRLPESTVKMCVGYRSACRSVDDAVHGHGWGVEVATRPLSVAHV